MQILVGFIWGVIGGCFTGSGYPLIPTLPLALLGYLITMSIIHYRDNNNDL